MPHHQFSFSKAFQCQPSRNVPCPLLWGIIILFSLSRNSNFLQKLPDAWGDFHFIHAFSDSTPMVRHPLFLHKIWHQRRVKSNPSEHAIIIPYRDRKFHLEKFVAYMNPYLQGHFPQSNFSLWIIEQDDKRLFNRAWLANVGIKEIIRQAPQTKCVILHDVDLVPNTTQIHIPYGTCDYPIQLGSALETWDWSYPYPTYCGGITSLSLAHWQLINGLSNDYTGWGGEDDDLYHRMRINGLLLQPTEEGYVYAPVPTRPTTGQGVFRAISQSDTHHVQQKDHGGIGTTLHLLSLMNDNSARWKHDGLNDAFYTITKQETNDSSSSRQSSGFKKIHRVWATAKKSKPNKQWILELVSIPHTGANTALTTLAAKNGIVWGACHYLDYFYPLSVSEVFGIQCPTEGSGDFKYKAQFEATYTQAQEPWHLPAKNFLDPVYGLNPLEGTKRFCVVRNPYERAIAFFQHTYRQQEARKYDNARELNTFLQVTFAGGKSEQLRPQTDYINVQRGNETQPYVHHILRYDAIVPDWDGLLQQYPYLRNVIDGKALEQILEHDQETHNRLNVDHLTTHTISLLNVAFEKDFSELNFDKIPVEMIQPTSTGGSTSTEAMTLLQFIDVPYNGGESLTRAASRAGVVWGACHFTNSPDLCPASEQSSQKEQLCGPLGATVSFQANPMEAQAPWLLPPSRFRTKHFTHSKKFAVVRNPYSRMIAFYRNMYDRFTRDQWEEDGSDLIKDREDPKKLNTFLQNILFRHHHPHHPDVITLPPLQSEFLPVDHVVRYELWRSELPKLLALYNMTHIMDKLIRTGLGPQSEKKPFQDLSIANLDNKTIHMINRHYKEDFEKWYGDALQPISADIREQDWAEPQIIHEALRKGTHEWNVMEKAKFNQPFSSINVKRVARRANLT